MKSDQADLREVDLALYCRNRDRMPTEEVALYGNQYVAFNWDGTEIVASAAEEAELVAKLDAMGIPQRCVGIAWMGL